jgi:ferredoxin-NADP reductase/ferredoxin
VARILYEDRVFESDGGSLLDGLTAQGIAVPQGCRAGICQGCLMQLREGSVPERARHGLTASMVDRGLFLACQCVPESDIVVGPADAVLEKTAARVSGIREIGRDIFRLRLRPDEPYRYRAGQFLRLYRDAGTWRNYSLASVPELDEDIELHVRRIPGGQVSGWVCGRAAAGDRVVLSEARGDCCYEPGKPDGALLLLATGTGLAPLYGIVRDALRQGHAGPLLLYHGSATLEGRYLAEELNALSRRHPQFRYRHCVPGGAPDALEGTPVEAALRDQPSLGGWRVYLCGNPEMVSDAGTAVFLAGASMSDILADPFVPNGSAPAP